MILAVVKPGSRIVARRGLLMVVSREGEKTIIPPDVELVVLVTGRCSVSGKALRLMAERGVSLAVLGSRGEPLAFLQPSVPNKTAATRLAQMRRVLSGEARLVAKQLVYAKILGQASNLKYLAKALREPWLRDRGYEIDSIAARVYNMGVEEATPDRLRVLEAAAARLYWSALAEVTPLDQFTGRCPECSDPVNAAISLSYAILYSVARRSLLLAGLDPYLGVMHSLKSGKESLVYDFSEPFKPAFDRALFSRPSRLRELRVTEAGLLDDRSRAMVVELAAGALERLYPPRG